MSYDFDGDPNQPVAPPKDPSMTEERIKQLRALCNRTAISEETAGAQALIEECLDEIVRQKKLIELDMAGSLQALAEMDKANYLTIERENKALLVQNSKLELKIQELEETHGTLKNAYGTKEAQRFEWQQRCIKLEADIAKLQDQYDVDMERCLDGYADLVKEKERLEEIVKELRTEAP